MALGLVATISALVLSLLLSTSKASYDARGNELIELSADILLLDRVLAYYGPEAGDARLQLRAAVREAIERFWPTDDAELIGFRPYALQLEGLHDRISQLLPGTETSSPARSGIAVDDRDQSRPFPLVSHGSRSIPTAFLIVLIMWLTVIFTGLGLFAPVNPTSITIFLVCALSAAGAIFLILELDDPLVGIIKISDEPLQLVLHRIGQ